MRPEDLDDEEGAPLAVGTARRAPRTGWREGGGCLGGGGWRGAEQRVRAVEVAAAGGTPEAVVAHLGTAGREDMLEEAVQELDARQGHPA